MKNLENPSTNRVKIKGAK